MKRTICLAIFILFVCSQSFGVTFGASFAPSFFDDVPKSHWAYPTINKLAQQGFLQGDKSGKFGGDKLVNRYEMGQIIANILSKVDYLKSAGELKITDSDLLAMEDLTVEFADELAFLCVKFDNMSKDLTSTKKEISNLKKDVKTLKYRAKNGNRADNFGFFGDMRIKHTDATKTQVGGDNVHTNAYLRLGFRARASENVRAVVRWTTYDYNYGLPAGSIGSANRIDNAYLAIDDFLKSKGDITVGRKYTSNGHYMVLNDYVDLVSYEKQAGAVKVTLNTIFDRVENKDTHHIWNLNAETDYYNNDLYLGLYARTLPDSTLAPIYTKRKMQIAELGGSGVLWERSGLSYDLGVVYSSHKREDGNKKESVAGSMKHVALNWEKRNELSGKVSYTGADHGFDGILSLDNETRYLGGPETPFEDVARFLNGMTGGLGGSQKFYNTSDFKLQLAFEPLGTKHYYRVAYDKVKEIKDKVSNDFVGTNVNLNALGYNKLDMNLTTFEYRYLLGDKTTFRMGYTRADKGRCLDSSDSPVSDEHLLWTELINLF